MKKSWLSLGIAVLLVSAIVIAGVRVSRHRTGKGAIPPPKELSPASPEVAGAIDYGKAHQKDLLVDFQKPWTSFLGYSHDGGIAVIYTPFHCLALMARNAAEENLAVDTGELCRLCAEKNRDLRFEVTLYGSETNFDRDYQSVVIVDGQQFVPFKIVEFGYDQAREYTIASRKDLYFTTGILEGKKKVVLRIIRPKEKTLDFVFDLKNVP